jgi:hypothetical protein
LPRFLPNADVSATGEGEAMVVLRSGRVLMLGVLLYQSPIALADDAIDLRFTRVRAVGGELRRLLREGDRRSSTFRALVDEIGQSNAIVVVELGFCGSGRFRSCVTHVEGDRRQRHIRIVVDTRTTSDRLVATIAHELQHAVEIVREPEVTDAARVLQLFRRIGAGRCRDGLSEACETDEALVVETKVLEELHAAPSDGA